MFKIKRADAWPPEVDLTHIRSTVTVLERDMRRVPQFVDVADALAEVIVALDQAEAKSPTRLSDRVVTTSRFTADPRRN